jgi:hypothetical protein
MAAAAWVHRNQNNTIATYTVAHRARSGHVMRCRLLRLRRDIDACGFTELDAAPAPAIYASHHA